MRAKLMPVVAILVAFGGTLHAADKSPNQTLGGKPAVSRSRSSQRLSMRPWNA